MKTQLISAVVLFAFATPALAAEPPAAANATPAMTVRYKDLDLRNGQDAKVMLHRIRKTAVEICRPGETGFEATARFETCYRKTVDEAVASLNAPRVTEARNAVAADRRLAKLP
jgi:UrcA family protein